MWLKGGKVIAVAVVIALVVVCLERYFEVKEVRHYYHTHDFAIGTITNAKSTGSTTYYEYEYMVDGNKYFQRSEYPFLRVLVISLLRARPDLVIDPGYSHTPHCSVRSSFLTNRSYPVVYEKGNPAISDMVLFRKEWATFDVTYDMEFDWLDEDLKFFYLP